MVMIQEGVNIEYRLNCAEVFAFQCIANQIHYKITQGDINKFAHFT